MKKGEKELKQFSNKQGNIYVNYNFHINHTQYTE